MSSDDAPRFLDGHSRANRHKPSGIAAKETILRVHLIPRLGGRRLDAITTEDIQRLKSRLSTKAPKTVNNVLTTLNRLLKSAVEWDVIEQMPCAIRLLPVPKSSATFHDFADFERLVDTARETDWRTYLIVLLGGEAGLRCGEMMALEQTDVDLTTRQLCVRRSDWEGHITVPKGGRLRYVPLTIRLARALREHRHLSSPRVLCLQDGALVREYCSSGTHCRYSWRSDAPTNTIVGMKSRVDPKYKTKYHVANWPEYERALVQRGDITLWLSADAIAAWTPAPSGRRGGQRKFSDPAIETALTLRLVFGLPLRQAEGFLRSALSLMNVDLDAPDHTTVSRRSQHLDVKLHRVPVDEPLHLIVDSTGLSIVGEGEWAAVKHGAPGTRGWKKLHFGVDGSGAIVAHVLTAGSADDATTGLTLIDAVEGNISRVTADTAYDTIAIYGAAGARWRDGRGASDEDRRSVSAETSGERSRSHHSEGQEGRAPPVEEGGGLPPAGPRGKRLLPVQVDHWRPASRSTSPWPRKLKPPSRATS